MEPRSADLGRAAPSSRRGPQPGPRRLPPRPFGPGARHPRREAPSYEPARGIARLDWMTHSTASRIPGPAAGAAVAARGRPVEAGEEARAAPRMARDPLLVREAEGYPRRSPRRRPRRADDGPTSRPSATRSAATATRSASTGWRESASRASAFIQAAMRISPVAASCTTAGIRPFASKRSVRAGALTPPSPRGGPARPAREDSAWPPAPCAPRSERSTRRARRRLCPPRDRRAGGRGSRPRPRR